MCGSSIVYCPYLQESGDISVCGIKKAPVRTISDVDERICSCRRYEACFIYLGSLKKICMTLQTPN